MKFALSTTLALALAAAGSAAKAAPHTAIDACHPGGLIIPPAPSHPLIRWPNPVVGDERLAIVQGGCTEPDLIVLSEAELSVSGSYDSQGNPIGFISLRIRF